MITASFSLGWVGTSSCRLLLFSLCKALTVPFPLRIKFNLLLTCIFLIETNNRIIILSGSTSDSDRLSLRQYFLSLRKSGFTWMKVCFLFLRPTIWITHHEDVLYSHYNCSADMHVSKVIRRTSLQAT